jgi:hypothetical protein
VNFIPKKKTFVKGCYYITLPESAVRHRQDGEPRALHHPQEDAQLAQPDPHHSRHVYRDFGGKFEIVLAGHVVVVDVNAAPARQKEGVGGRVLHRQGSSVLGKCQDLQNITTLLMEPDACDVDNDDHVPDPNFSLKRSRHSHQKVNNRMNSKVKSRQ